MENNTNTNIDEDRIIEITLENGEKVEGEILFTFEANGDDFVLYEVQEELFAAKVDEQGQLKPIEEDEWSLVEKVYEEYQETYEEEGEEVE
ncbi:MAG: DUF1292 domain-containing protein [Mycoplasmatales bacterium]|nr:DUF1292 domain-containing protein [Mycoplasmatales bacterium]